MTLLPGSDEALSLICEAVRYCQRVRGLGMPPSCYTKALREPVHFLWERRFGPKQRCAKYRSENALGLRAGKGELVYDHAIPFNYCQEALLALNDVTPATVRAVLERYAIIALITKSEDALLRQHKMPDDWDGIDHLARYKGIVTIIPNPDWTGS